METQKSNVFSKCHFPVDGITHSHPYCYCKAYRSGHILLLIHILNQENLNLGRPVMVTPQTKPPCTNKQHSLLEYFFCDGNYECDPTLKEFCKIHDVSNAETKAIL